MSEQKATRDSISATQLRLRDVSGLVRRMGERPLVITRHGKQVAALVSMKWLGRYQALETWREITKHTDDDAATRGSA